MIVKMAQGILIQKDISARCTHPRRIGVNASEHTAETTKKLTAWHVTSQSSMLLIHGLEGPRFPDDIKFADSV
jgi:hypothetical protein